MSDLTNAFWALALANFTGSYAAVHKTDSGRTELSGSGYARQALTFAAESGGQRVNTNVVSVPTGSATPSSTEVGWLGVYSAVTAGTQLAIFPMGIIAEYEAIVSATDTISTGQTHGFSAGDRVCFEAYDNALPSGLTVGVSYYVLASGLTSTAFKVSTTAGGTAVSLSASSAVGCIVRKFTPIITNPSSLVDFGVGAVTVGK